MDSLFFWLSKLLWLFLSPDSLFLVLVLLAWLLCWRGAQRAAARLLGTVAVLLLVVALFPVGEWMLSPLEQRFETNPPLPQDIDGIIVLGGAELPFEALAWQQVELNDSAERLLTFASLARRYPTARLVYTGGSGSMLYQQHKGADVAEAFFEDQSIDLSRLVVERQSRNTYENAILAFRKAAPEPGEKWILVTTAWHMPRSVGVFCQAGWPTIPYPVDHWSKPEITLRPGLNLAGNLQVLKAAAKEWVGLSVYYFTRKTATWIPGGCEWP